MSEPVLEVQGVALAHGPREILRDLTFRIARGQVLALVGRNGSGKSSLLRVLSGLRAPRRGQVHWLGRPSLPAGHARVRVLGVMLQHEPSMRSLDFSLGRGRSEPEQRVGATQFFRSVIH